MQNPWQNILPKDTVRVFRQDVITDVDKKVVSLLYLPFLGPQTTALYSYLLNAVETTTNTDLTHYTMMTMLQLTPKDYYEIRSRLEAVGLLTTYYKDDAQTRFMCQLHPPVTPFVFFNDPLYSGLLKQHVDEQQFHQLKRHFIVETVVVENYQNISQSFAAVFGEHVSYYRDNDGQVVNQERIGIRISDDSFNWAYFMQLLANTMIREEHLTPEIKQSIYMAATLYGVTPIQMRNYVYDAYHMGYDKVDKDKLLQLVRQDASKQVVSQNQSEAEHLSADKYVQLEKEGYSPEMIDLIKKFDQTTPAMLIKQIKTAKNARNEGSGIVQVEQSELKLIEDLMLVNRLNASVVNVLLHYVLVVMDNALFTEKFAKKIASDWINRKLTSAEQVIVHLKQRDDKYKNQPQVTQNRGVKPSRIVTLSEAEKQALHASDKPVSQKDQEQLKYMLDTL